MTSPAMFEMLAGMLSGPLAAQIANRLGTDEAVVKKAIAMALPMLISALARNASSQQGAASLAGALERDHDGSLLDNVPDFVTSGDTTDGGAILGHVLGDQLGAAEMGIGRATGMDQDAVAGLMSMLAPMVLAYLGQQQRKEHLDPGGLGDLLRQEEKQIEEKPPNEMGDLVEVFLDRDGDGDIKDDAAEIGMSMLQGWLRGR